MYRTKPFCYGDSGIKYYNLVLTFAVPKIICNLHVRDSVLGNSFRGIFLLQRYLLSKHITSTHLCCIVSRNGIAQLVSLGQDLEKIWRNNLCEIILTSIC